MSFTHIRMSIIIYIYIHLAIYICIYIQSCSSFKSFWRSNSPASRQTIQELPFLQNKKRRSGNWKKSGTLRLPWIHPEVHIDSKHLTKTKIRVKKVQNEKKKVPTHQSNFMRFFGGTNRNFIETKPTETPIDFTVALGPSTFNCTKEEQITRRTWWNQRKRWVARGRNPKEEDGGMLDLHRYIIYI